MPAQKAYETDRLETAAGDVEIMFLGHGTLMLTYNGKRIHVDPYGHVADYSKLPKADLVLVTHGHHDHLDKAALAKIMTPLTQVVVSKDCEGQVPGAIVMRNGETRTVEGVKIEAVPAYNTEHKRPSGEPFHPQGDGNGYIVTLGGARIYVAGDTEPTPEMMALEEIDVAFLPMNLPYTMTPEMVAEAARAFRPGILYPYHFGDTDTSKLERLLSDAQDIEVRIRDMA